MFPSSYSSYSCSGPYPCYPSSSSSSSFPPFTFLNPENNAPSNNNNNNTTFLIHDPLPVPYNIPSQHAPNIPESLSNLAVADCAAAAAMFKQEVMSGGGAHHYGISNLLSKKPAKKDRHSKIHTSQGLRDRRVRLSIEIARKFFDLQDMLGFDKASNTLEWLLTKSKRAIKELARSKNCSNAANSFSSSSEGEVDSVINQVIDGTGELQQGVLASEERKLRRTQKEESRAKMKESREKARARARERTSNKMCNNNDNINTGSEKVQDLKKKCPAMEDPQFLHQLRSTIQPHEEPARSPKLVQPHPHPHLVGSEAPRDDFNVIEESIVIKRKLKQSLMSSSHHQNHVIPKEASFNNSGYHSYPNLSPNWEANNGATGRSNFCTIASMNLSTRLQIFGKSREECTNPRL